jgi:hypothetical protein
MSAIDNPSHVHVGGGQIAKTRRREDDCYLNAASLPVTRVNAVAILEMRGLPQCEFQSVSKPPNALQTLGMSFRELQRYQSMGVEV